MSEGALVVNGRTFAIQSVALLNGMIRLTTVPFPGPISAIPPCRITIFGKDGIGIGQGDWGGATEIPEGDYLSFTYELKVTRIDE